MNDFNDPNAVVTVTLTPQQIKLLQGSENTRFISMFFAILFANLLTGVLLFFGFRYYVKWSVEDSIEKVRQNVEKQNVKSGR